MCEAYGSGRETSGHIFRSVRLLVMCGYEDVLFLKPKESGMMSLSTWSGILCLSNMLVMKF